jgi:quinol monooxygenase YgiN
MGENDMLIQCIHFTFAPEDADRAEAMLRELRDASRKEEGVTAFDVGRSRERPNVFVLWEEYRDEAALAAHQATEHFKRLALNGVRALARERNAETVFLI